MSVPAEAHSEDAIELGGHEGQAGLGQGLGERLILHRDTSHLSGRAKLIVTLKFESEAQV